MDRINKIKHRGQTYDGAINELLDFHDSGFADSQNQPHMPKVTMRGKARARIGSDSAEAKS